MLAADKKGVVCERDQLSQPSQDAEASGSGSAAGCCGCRKGERPADTSANCRPEVDWACQCGSSSSAHEGQVAVVGDWAPRPWPPGTGGTAGRPSGCRGAAAAAEEERPGLMASSGLSVTRSSLSSFGELPRAWKGREADFGLAPWLCCVAEDVPSTHPCQSRASLPVGLALDSPLAVAFACLFDSDFRDIADVSTEGKSRRDLELTVEVPPVLSCLVDASPEVGADFPFVPEPEVDRPWPPCDRP